MNAVFAKLICAGAVEKSAMGARAAISPAYEQMFRKCAERR
jgi:hypothetical protein